MWDYTPAQAMAYTILMEKRRRRERGRDLATYAMAVRADIRDINAKIKSDTSVT